MLTLHDFTPLYGLLDASRSCPEKCYPDDESMESKEPTSLDRFIHGFHQWVSRSWQRGLEKIAKAIQAVKKHE